MLIAVLSSKGGVGKSTVTTNLAAAAHLAGVRTLVLDLDAQGSSLDWYAARRDGSRLADLPVVKVDRALSAPQLLAVTNGYDLAILDGPPRLSEVTRSAAVAADVVLIPVQPGPFDLWAAGETLRLLDLADATRADLGKPPVRRLFVVNRATAGTVLARQAPKVLGDAAEVAGVIHQRIVFAEAVATGESVLTLDPDGPAAREILDLYGRTYGGTTNEAAA